METPRIIMVDWSAASGVTRPGPDTIYLAWNDAEQVRVEHCSTRLTCQERIVALAAAWTGPVLVGCDFAFGYPREAGLPAGRALCDMLADVVTESAEGVSNRFAVAAMLNREVARMTGEVGPFWGRPVSVREADLPTMQPTSRVPMYRARERTALSRAREWGRIQSAFKCAYPASVGSQTITGLACVGRMLRDFRIAGRALLWPFETAWDEAIEPNAIVFAEVWPATQVQRVRADVSDDVRDAKQVRAMVRWAQEAWPKLLARPGEVVDDVERARCEGWILGVEVGGSDGVRR